MSCATDELCAEDRLRCSTRRSHASHGNAHRDASAGSSMTNSRVASSARLVPRWARPVESAKASRAPTVSGGAPSSNSYSIAPLMTDDEPDVSVQAPLVALCPRCVFNDCPAMAFDVGLAGTYSGNILLPLNSRKLDRDVFDGESETGSILWHGLNLTAVKPAVGPLDAVRLSRRHNCSHAIPVNTNIVVVAAPLSPNIERCQAQHQPPSP
jgi:hypothetical protein